MLIKYKGKKIDIPECIPCTQDNGYMVYEKRTKSYKDINIPGCNNKIKLKEFLKNSKKDNQELEF